MVEECPLLLASTCLAPSSLASAFIEKAAGDNAVTASPPSDGHWRFVLDLDSRHTNSPGVADICAFRFLTGIEARWAIHSGIKTFPIFSDGFESGTTTAW